MLAIFEIPLSSQFFDNRALGGPLAQMSIRRGVGLRRLRRQIAPWDERKMWLAFAAVLAVGALLVHNRRKRQRHPQVAY